MVQQANPPPDSADAPVRALYRSLLEAWNSRQAEAYAALFTQDGSQVGFDGSTASGRDVIEAHLKAIFTDHLTGRYVGIIREVRFLSQQAALVLAVAGIVPHGQRDLNPALNAVQSLVAARGLDGQWRVVHYQNTPAQFHGQPEMADRLTQELKEKV
jgi:uncharacterized protein (TIGR02246 family)